MPNEEPKNCVEKRFQLCGGAFDVVIDFQSAYRKKHKRVKSVENTINYLLKEYNARFGPIQP